MSDAPSTVVNTNRSSTDKTFPASFVKLAPIFSAIFMGTGQLICLRQWIRGAFFALCEILMIIFNQPIIKSIKGLITLGDPHPELPAKLRDHSIFMMITGLITVVIILIFIVLYFWNIRDAYKSSKEFCSEGAYPTKLQRRNKLQQSAFPAFGIIPILILIAFFTIVPLLFSALVAFTNYSSPDHIPPANTVDWVGLQNFKEMFFMGAGTGDNSWTTAFLHIALWTVIWAVISTFSCYFAGLFFAVILQDKRIKIASVYRAIFILPYAIPQMLSLFVWANLLNGTMGPINKTLQYFGIIQKAIPWLSDPTMAKVTLCLVNVWIGFPYSMILTTSSMTAISNSLYEAAVIDGANKWEQFRSITLPLVLFQTMPLLIMQFAGNINNFGAVFFLTGGGPNLVAGGTNLTISTQAGATDLLISWIYKLTMNTPNKYNMASVLSILVFIVLVPFAVYNFTHTKSFKEGEV